MLECPLSHGVQMGKSANFGTQKSRVSYYQKSIVNQFENKSMNPQIPKEIMDVVEFDYDFMYYWRDVDRNQHQRNIKKSSFGNYDIVAHPPYLIWNQGHE